MNRQNRLVSTKVYLVVLGAAMLVATPGGAVQKEELSVMPALVSEAQLNQTAKQKIRDCSLGIPCTRRVVNYQMGYKQTIALAAMMRLGVKARVN